MPVRQQINHWSLEKTGSSISCSENEPGSGLRRLLLRDQLCNFSIVRIGFLLIKLSFDLRSRSILPYRGSGNNFESAGQKDLQRFLSLGNGAGRISLPSFFWASQTIGYSIQFPLEIRETNQLIQTRSTCLMAVLCNWAKSYITTSLKKGVRSDEPPPKSPPANQ